MKFQRYKAVAIKELIHLFRDWRSLGMGLAIPSFLLVFFGYALSMDVKDINLIMVDYDHSSSSRELASSFRKTEVFNFLGTLQSYKDLDNYLSRNKASTAIIIPENFGEKFSSSNNPEIQIIVDGSDANTARLSLSYCRQVVNKFIVANFPQLQNPLENFSIKVLYNPWMESKNGVIPGLIAVIIMIIAAMLTSLTIAREYEAGTFEQLISTPIRPMELIIGKLTPYFIMGILDVFLAVLTAVWLFKVPLKGNLIFLAVSSLLFLTGSLMMGITISIITKNQLLACQISIVTTYLPGFLLSGFVFDLNNMPWAIRMVSYVIPARYFVTILHSVFLKGGGFSYLWPDLIFLIVFSGITVILALRKMKLQLD
jgi:ABC-2 type transport system permease protein